MGSRTSSISRCSDADVLNCTDIGIRVADYSCLANAASHESDRRYYVGTCFRNFSRGFRYIDRLATHDVAVTAAANARSQIYHNLVAVPPSTVLGMSRGRLLSFIGPDIDALTDKIVRATIPRRVAIYTGVLAVALTATLSLLAAGILAVGLAFAGIVVPWIAAQGRKESLNCSGHGRLCHSC